MTPKISIIVPVYNVEKYLSTCLDSLINQTLKDIEIICVNDGSTDSSLKILNEYAQKDPRIVVIDKENSGPSSCRNLGIKKAKGEYIQFVDSDDWIEKETCETCYKKALEQNVDMVSFNAKTIYGKKTHTQTYYNTTEEKLVNLKDISPLLFKSPFHSWHYLFKKVFLTSNELIYPQNIVLAEDVIFILNCWLNVKKAVLLPNCFYNYVQCENSITHTTKHVFDIFPVIKKIKQIIVQYDKKNINLKKDAQTWCINHLFWFYQKLETYDDIKKFKKLAYQTNCIKEYQDMIKKLKNPTQLSFYFKLFGILPIFSIKQKKDKKQYKFLGLPILSVKKRGNATYYTFFKICLAKIIRK